MKVKRFFLYISRIFLINSFNIFNLETVETSEESDQIVVENTISVVESMTTETVGVEIVNQEQTQEQQLEQKNQEDGMEHHPTKDEIEEYEESQRKFRELWEKKREKVSLNFYFHLKESLHSAFKKRLPMPFFPYRLYHEYNFLVSLCRKSFFFTEFSGIVK